MTTRIDRSPRSTATGPSSFRQTGHRRSLMRVQAVEQAPVCASMRTHSRACTTGAASDENGREATTNEIRGISPTRIRVNRGTCGLLLDLFFGLRLVPQGRAREQGCRRMICDRTGLPQLRYVKTSRPGYASREIALDSRPGMGRIPPRWLRPTGRKRPPG